MKTTSKKLLRKFLLLSLFTCATMSYAQVGINTTTPADDAILDITSGDKGMLVPRVDIADLSTIAPITGGSTESLLVYNTNATTGTGFYYWNGTLWVGLGNNGDWKELGNAGTNPATNFVGTTDNVGLRFRTNNTERFEITNDGRFLATESGTAASPLFGWSGDNDKGFYSPGADQFGLVTNGTERLRIPNANQIYAMANGSNSAPFYSFNSDSDVGIWRSAGDRLNFSVGGREFIEMRENGANSELAVNDGGATTDFRVEGVADANLIFADAANDNVGIGIAPTATNKLEVFGDASANQDAIQGYTANVGGVLGREQDISFGVPTQTILGAGVYANNPFAGYGGMFTQSTGTANVGAMGAYSDVWIGSYAYIDDNGNSASNPPAAYAQRNVTNASNNLSKAASRSLLIRGTTAGNPGFSVGSQSLVISDNEDGYGIEAIFAGNSGGLGGTNAGGRFVSTDSGFTTTSLTYVAGYIGGTDYKVLGTGAVSTIVKDQNQEERIMFAPEAPEVLFQDYGVGRLVNGTANITLDPIMSQNILVDSSHPLKVFVTLEGDCKGVYVTNKSANGFTVKELQNGSSSVDFSWQIVASRADSKDRNNKVVSKFEDLRFPKLNTNKLKKNGNGRFVEQPKVDTFMNSSSNN